MIDAVVGHLVGDYLLQNDWMASNKKSSTVICSVHCAIWATSVSCFSGWPFWLWPILFFLHMLQDRTLIVVGWMKMVGQEGFVSGPCSPWSVIVVDNVWHIVSLWVIWKIAVDATGVTS